MKKVFSMSFKDFYMIFCAKAENRDAHVKRLTRPTFSAFSIISGEFFFQKSKKNICYIPFDSSKLIILHNKKFKPKEICTSVENSTNLQIFHYSCFAFCQNTNIYVLLGNKSAGAAHGRRLANL